MGFSPPPEKFFEKQPETGSIFTGIKNFTERELTIDAGQIMGYLWIFE